MVVGAHDGIARRDELCGAEFAGVPFPVHESFECGHNLALEFHELNFVQHVFDALGGFFAHCTFLDRAQILQRLENRNGVLRAAHILEEVGERLSKCQKNLVFVINEVWRVRAGLVYH